MIFIAKSTVKQRNGSAQQEDGSVMLGVDNQQGVRHNVSVKKGGGCAEKVPKWGTFGKAPTLLLAFFKNANNNPTYTTISVDTK